MAQEHSRPTCGQSDGRSGPRGWLAHALGERVLLLDGALGTELERRGLRCGLPLWSARALLDAPQAVEEIHAAYLAAGAELITANTFRTQRRTLAKEGLAHETERLCRLAIELARCARPRSAVAARVAGSVPPLEDCYRPELAPPDAALAREHAEHCELLAGAGADWLLLETHGSVREAAAAARAASATGLPFALAFVFDRAGRLLSGEDPRRAVDAVLPSGPCALLVNCVPPDAAGARHAALAALAPGVPTGLYPNLGAPGPTPDAPRSGERSPEELAALARAWIRAGARLVGGCCGTTPRHIRALAGLLGAR